MCCELCFNRALSFGLAVCVDTSLLALKSEMERILCICTEVFFLLHTSG